MDLHNITYLLFHTNKESFIIYVYNNFFSSTALRKSVLGIWLLKVNVMWNVYGQTALRVFFSYLLTYLLTYSMEQSPSWEASRFSASQEIPHISGNPKIHYFSHKCPPPVPILNQLDPVHNPTSQFLKINLNIILPSTPGSPHWSLSFRFPHQHHVHPSPIRATCPAHLILLDFTTRTISGKEYRSLSSSLCNFLHSLLPRLS